MEWLLANPQIRSTFASLGSHQDDTYIVNDKCCELLDEINVKLAMEDHTLRSFRRAIGFGQNVKKDIIPLLIGAKEHHIIDGVLRLMVNLTVPIECLLSVEVMSRTDIGRHTIYELNHLLITSKEVFIDPRTTRAIVDHMKNILESDNKLSLAQCDSINNCLLLLRNILHIPESDEPSTNGHQQTSLQNQILWNLFTQSIDKLLLHLMSCSQKSFWVVTIVQLVALMYKDQHVVTLQKMLNHWFEAGTHSESSEDNESNTSPGKQCSGDSSPMLTSSDPTSDSSDNGCRKMKTHSISQDSDSSPIVNTIIPHFPKPMNRIKPTNQSSAQKSPSLPAVKAPTIEEYLNQDVIMKCSDQSASPNDSSNSSCWSSVNKHTKKSQKSQRPVITKQNRKHHYSSNNQSELSDCGYQTQVSQQGDQIQEENISNSTSSNDDERIHVHQKPPSTTQKQRFNAAQKQRNAIAANTPANILEKKDARRKKLVKRSRSTIINMKGLIHHTPTDDDISNILKEFTIDFLLKSYGCLVKELHEQLLNDMYLSIDTSHFFWLVTYFLKFASQLELDLEHISSVLSFEIISYLTYEGVSLCEQLELNSRQEGVDLKPWLRRIHLVVTAIREFLQALDVYKRSSHLSNEDREHLTLLQVQISAAEDTRNLFVLLLRCFNPKVQGRQYLEALVVTNHLLLLLLDNVSNMSDCPSNVNMVEHIQQFADIEIMHHYGILLENFNTNGEYVNDCIFTMMHHVGGEINQVSLLFQPTILKTFSRLWDAEHEICDDWVDLIEYVFHKFLNKPTKPQIALEIPVLSQLVSHNDMWTQDDKDSLSWYYMQSNNSKDIIGNIMKQISDSGSPVKSRISVIQNLSKEGIITEAKHDELMKREDINFKTEVTIVADVVEEEQDLTDLCIKKPIDDIKVLRDNLIKENKGGHIMWLQKVLLECCFVKLSLQESSAMDTSSSIDGSQMNHLHQHIMAPIPYHCTLKKQSIPLIPHNNEQTKILAYEPFVMLLHKLGFHLPADANKMYVRIPEFWTADFLLAVAQKLGPLPKSSLKFDLDSIRTPEIDSNEIPLTITIPTMNDSDIKPSMFAVQRSRTPHSLIRFTPEPTPCLPTWLQMVKSMKNKTSTSERVLISSLPPSPIVTASVTESTHTFLQTPLIIHKALHLITEMDIEDDVVIKHNMISPIVEDHEVIDSFETNSIASSLLTMYVSDEEDKHDDDSYTTNLQAPTLLLALANPIFLNS